MILLSDISNVNSTLYSQTVTLLSNIENVNSTIYSQTVSILSNIENMNSTIYSQTVTLLSDISNVNTTLYSQTVTLLSNIENINSTLYTQTLTILSDISNVNTTLYSQVVTILSNIENVNSTIYSQTISILSNLSALNATVYLIDDPTHLNFLIAGYAFSDDYCDFTIVTTWHNSTLSLYENDVLVAGPVSEVLGPLRYTLNEAIGSYNLSLFIDAGADSLWYNVSYTVTGEDWCYISPYFPSGVGYPLTNFRLYINNTRIYDRDWKFYNRTDWIYNVTITDFFGEEVYSGIHAWARGIDILVPVYEFSVSHMLTTTYIKFELTGPSGQSWSTIVHPNDVVRFYLFSSGRYEYSYAGIFNATAGALPDYKTYTGEITDISEDCGIVIVSWGVDKILYEIAVKPTGGGGVTYSDIKSLMADTVGDLQASYIILAVVIIGANMMIVVWRGGGSDTFVKVSGEKPPLKQDSDGRRSNRPPKEYQYDRGRTYDPTSRMSKRRMKQ